MKLWGWNTKPSAPSKEAEKIKSQTHQQIRQTDKDIRRLNRLLEANGITLRIYIATGRRHA